MKKNLPPSTLNELRTPNESHNYFENWQANPFKHDATDFELVNAWWLAEAALLAYGSEDFVNQKFEAAGLKGAGFAVQSFVQQNVQCFVAHNDQFIIASFRGTEVDNFWGSVMDVASDLKFIPVPDGFGGLVHQGFHHAISAVWEAVKNHLSQIQNSGGARTLWLTGHSLGAAIATLAAERIAADGDFEVRGLYTFGSPRVGDGGFKNRLTESGLAARTFRFVNNSDIISKVPPGILYTHIGALKYIDNSGHLHHLTDESQIVSDADLIQLSQSLLHKFNFLRHVGGFNIIIPGFIADHAPIYYALNVWNNYDQA
jgi:triacylglycerol lipase